MYTSTYWGISKSIHLFMAMLYFILNLLPAVSIRIMNNYTLTFWKHQSKLLQNLPWFSKIILLICLFSKVIIPIRMKIFCQYKKLRQTQNIKSSNANKLSIGNVPDCPSSVRSWLIPSRSHTQNCGGITGTQGAHYYMVGVLKYDGSMKFISNFKSLITSSFSTTTNFVGALALLAFIPSSEAASFPSFSKRFLGQIGKNVNNK